MKDIRNHIKQAANQHTELVNNDTLWAGIEDKMEISKKRRRIIPIWLLGFLLSVIVLAFVGLLFTFNNSELLSSSIESNINSNQDQSARVVIPTEVTLPKSKLPTNIPSNIDGSDIEDESKNLSIDEVTLIKKTKTKTPFISFENKIHEVSKYTQSQLSFETTKTNKQDLITEQIEISSNSRSTSKNAANGEGLDMKPSNSVEEIRLINMHKISTLIFGVYHDKPKLIISTGFTALPQSPSTDNKPLSFFKSLTIFGQYGLGSKTIQGNGPNIVIRNDTEKLLEQIRFGIESDLIRFHDFTFYSGLSYVSFNDQLKIEETYNENRVITYLKEIKTMSDGTEVEIFATEELPHQINTKAIRYNSHRLISMPIGIRFGKRFSNIQFGVGFGIDLNYAFSDVHTVIGDDGVLTSMALAGNWINPSMHTSLSVDYPITQRLSLHSTINYRNTTFENLQKEGSAREIYSVYGLDFGIKINFNSK